MSVADIKNIVSGLAEGPGVYLFMGESSEVLYVGKAVNLKKRVQSYFRKAAMEHPRLRQLVREIRDIRTMPASTEVAALLLERNMIREHRPRYNIIFRDDKEYPMIRVDPSHPWPRIEKVRRQKKGDTAIYLGPFPQAGALNKVLEVIRGAFPLVRCTEHEFLRTKRPCNYYHMNKCLAPCCLEVDPELYRQMISDALDLLRGKNQEVRDRLEKKMFAAAERLDFWQAALLRDQIRAMSELQVPSKGFLLAEAEYADTDIIAMKGSEDQMHVQILSLRSQQLRSSEEHIVNLSFQKEDEVLEQFLLQYYAEKEIPTAIMIPSEPSGFSALKTFFSSHQCRLFIPAQKHEHKLMELARKDAELSHKKRKEGDQERQNTLNKLQIFLGLNKVPERIECLDISHIQGTATVASIVHFYKGKALKSMYRHYNLEAEGKPDDFTSIAQIMRRRLRRGRENNDLPDLILIDGGKGQLNAAVRIAEEEGCGQTALASIAKSRSFSRSHSDSVMHKSDERIFLPGRSEALIPQPGSAVFRLLVTLRDEAHRFAIQHHRKRRKNIRHSSFFESVPGIGPVLRKRLLMTFQSRENLLKAPREELIKVKGISPRLADEILSYLKKT
ncbi:MAG: excinuclease ABC subunit UvrC [Deltaproteobacteria bacterium]|nr:excinuclease ABC subunit UvrC [Deltaproteobacteria bacterium]